MRTTSTTCSATSARSALNGPGRVFDRAVVVIPAHNEADNLPTSAKGVLTAAACLPLPVAVIVVLDGCDDGSAALAGQFGSDVHFVAIDTRNVGAARAVGFPTRARCANRRCSTIRGSGMPLPTPTAWSTPTGCCARPAPIPTWCSA
jgi:Glycosyl transferase family 2